MPTRRRPGRASAPWTAFHAILAVAILVLTATIVAASWSFPPPEAPAASTPGTGDGGTAWGNCTRSGGGACALAPAGANWSLGPTSAWCVRNQSGWTRCASEALILGFSEPANSSPHGVLRVYGAFQVWIIPAARDCDLLGRLAGAGIPCDQWLGYVPPFTWNRTYPAGAVNLSSLPFSYNGSTGILPPFPWEIWIVDLEPTPVFAIAVTDLSELPR